MPRVAYFFVAGVAAVGLFETLLLFVLPDTAPFEGTFRVGSPGPCKDGKVFVRISPKNITVYDSAAVEQARNSNMRFVTTNDFVRGYYLSQVGQQKIGTHAFLWQRNDAGQLRFVTAAATSNADQLSHEQLQAVEVHTAAFKQLSPLSPCT